MLCRALPTPATPTAKLQGAAAAGVHSSAHSTLLGVGGLAGPTLHDQSAIGTDSFCCSVLLCLQGGRDLQPKDTADTGRTHAALQSSQHTGKPLTWDGAMGACKPEHHTPTLPHSQGAGMHCLLMCP